MTDITAGAGDPLLASIAEAANAPVIANNFGITDDTSAAVAEDGHAMMDVEEAQVPVMDPDVELTLEASAATAGSSTAPGITTATSTTESAIIGDVLYPEEQQHDELEDYLKHNTDLDVHVKLCDTNNNANANDMVNVNVNDNSHNISAPSSFSAHFFSTMPVMFAPTGNDEESLRLAAARTEEFQSWGGKLQFVVVEEVDIEPEVEAEPEPEPEPEVEVVAEVAAVAEAAPEVVADAAPGAEAPKEGATTEMETTDAPVDGDATAGATAPTEEAKDAAAVTVIDVDGGPPLVLDATPIALHRPKRSARADVKKEAAEKEAKAADAATSTEFPDADATLEKVAEPKPPAPTTRTVIRLATEEDLKNCPHLIRVQVCFAGAEPQKRKRVPKTPASASPRKRRKTATASATKKKKTTKASPKKKSKTTTKSKATPKKKKTITKHKTPSAAKKTVKKKATAASASKKKPASAVKEKSIRAPEPELKGEGKWMRTESLRQHGTTAGTTDKYWISPQEKFRFRSMAQVKRFLKCLKKAKGDEQLAHDKFKRGQGY